MPTGLTHPIHDGTDPSPRAFFIRCMSQFGAYVHLRDSSQEPQPIEGEFDETPHQERIQRIRDELEAIEVKDDDWWEQEAVRTNTENLQENHRAQIEALASRQRYEKVLLEIRKWTPPTTDHQSYKDLMLHQVEESMRFDCAPLPSRTDLTGPELREQRLGSTRRSLEYAERDLVESRDRFESHKAWANAIWNTLDEVAE